MDHGTQGKYENASRKDGEGVPGYRNDDTRRGAQFELIAAEHLLMRMPGLVCACSALRRRH